MRYLKNVIAQLSADDSILEDEHLKEYDPEEAADALRLYADNTREIYERYFIPTVKGMIKKIKGGAYDSELALPAFLRLMTVAAQMYIKEMGEFDEITDWQKAFPKQVREMAARDLLKDVYEQIKSGEFDWLEKRGGLDV